MGPGKASTILAMILVPLLLAWFWVRGERFIDANGPTFDEGVHLAAGYSYWTAGNFRMNAEDPPLLKLLWSLPLLFNGAPPFPVEMAASTTNHWQIAKAWLYDSGVSPRLLLDPARRVNLALGCCVVILSGWWAYRAWGSKLAGLATCAFAASDPTLLALSCILSTDVGLTFFALLTCYLLWEYTGSPSRGLLIGAGLSLGLMLATKFSAVGVVAGLGLAGLLYIYSGGTLALPGKQSERGFRPALELAIRLGAIAIPIAAATYGFIHFDQWGKGLKFQLTRSEHGDGIMYLNGELSRQGWYHYFVLVILYKISLGVLIAAAVACTFGIARLVTFARKQDRNSSESQEAQDLTRLRSHEIHRALWLVVPPVAFFLLASYSRMDMGIRVVLPALPFLYILAGGLGAVRCCKLPARVLLAGLLVWCGVTAQQANPHELAYFNELSRAAARDKPVLADSNLDWGQGLPLLKKWMDAEGVEQVYLGFFGTDLPEAHGIRYQLLPGYGQVGALRSETIPAHAKRHIVAVSSNHLYGLFLNDPDLYAWLQSRKPVAVLDGCIHIFDLTGDIEAISRVRSLTDQ